MIKDLAKLATKLDRLGLTKEADVLDSALKKLAQQVATTGVEGATYSGGRQMTPGFAGGPTVKFYKAKPKSISEFNAFLGGLISDAAKDPSQTAFSDSVLKNLPRKSDNTWTPRTNAAFKEYAVAAGEPDAGVNWEAFAKKSRKYAPSIDGVYRFYDDTIDRVYRELALDKALEEMKVPDEEGRAAPILSERSGRGVAMPERGPTYDPANPLADLKHLIRPESSVAQAATGTNAQGSKQWGNLHKDFIFEYTWLVKDDPLNSLAFWNISDDNKKRIFEAWNARTDNSMSTQDWCRKYIYENRIPGGWLTRNVSGGGGKVQKPMTPITRPPLPPEKVNPRNLDSHGGSFNQFKEEVERFPKDPVIFMGYTGPQLDAYLAEVGFKRVNGKLVDLTTTPL
jgi:hypothetical protein